MRLSSCTRRSRVTEEVLRDGCEAGSFSPRQGAKASFDGRNVCQKCFCVTFDESNKAFAVSGTSYFHRERTCD